jgi:phospholipid transport system transporter-binding protein|tara:strand:+ start:367 stop:684 length:318 start_codon:yes stop_codon:yes gene_type:complete
VRNITWVLTENSIIFTGELTRHTVPNIPDQLSNSLFKHGALNTCSIVLEFKAVTKIDTAGLAWLLLQVEHARAANCQLHFASLPSALIKLAQLSAVDEFLPHLAD